MTPNLDLQLPRDQWPDHPNYPDQVLLLGSHDSFRRTSAGLIRRAEAGDSNQAIGSMFRYWKSAMRGHEGYEEHKLYPYLNARWGISCAALARGHRQLAEADRTVRDVLAQTDGPATAALVDVLRSHHDVLFGHLAHEEAVVIPALLALTPTEFRAYYHGNIHTLLLQLGGQ